MHNIKEIKGNILQKPMAEKTVILHGCNCFHTMGAGVARHLANRFPTIRQADKTTIYGDQNKLGSYSWAIINDNLHILNCYTQYRYGRKDVFVQYPAVEKVLYQVAHNYDTSWEIRMPHIGCGNAGGNWEVVRKIVEEVFKTHKVKIFYL